MSGAFDFADVFDEDYLYFYEPRLVETSDADAEIVWRLLELEPGMEVLGLACGHGRITNGLAERGVSPGWTRRRSFSTTSAATRPRGVEVEYVHGDMRSLPWRQSRFDRVVRWVTCVLREAHRAPRPGGKLLIENNNLAGLLPRWLPAIVVERDGDFSIDRSTFDPKTGRATPERG